MRFKIWVESLLQSRIDSLKGFRSTPETPYPSMASGDEMDDVLGVLAGVKPGAVVTKSKLLADPDYKEILAHLKSHGYVIKDRHTPDQVALGRPDAVEKLVSLSHIDWFRKQRGIPKDPQFHADYATALGISNDALMNLYHRLGISHKLAASSG